MKKLIVMLAIAASAAVVSASTVTWSADSWETVSAGQLVYCFLQSDTSGFVTKTLAAATADEYASKQSTLASLNDYILKTTGVEDEDGNLMFATGKLDGSTNWGAGESIKGYAVVFNAANIGDATKYMVTDVATVNFSNTGNNKSFDLAEGTWKNIESVPEPTSGLLLLLGVAGLALRRRRA